MADEENAIVLPPAEVADEGHEDGVAEVHHLPTPQALGPAPAEVAQAEVVKAVKLGHDGGDTKATDACVTLTRSDTCDVAMDLHVDAAIVDALLQPWWHTRWQGDHSRATTLSS